MTSITKKHFDDKFTALEQRLQNLESENIRLVALNGEIHQLVNNLHTKLDIWSTIPDKDQSKSTTKRTTKTKTITKKRKVTSKVNNTDDPVEEPDHISDATEDDAVEVSDEESDNVSETSTTKPATRPTVKKTITKKIVRKPSATAGIKAPNKMNFFKQKYTEDPDYFGDYIDADVREQLEADHAAELEDLSDSKRKTKLVELAYKYMKENHDDQLVRMTQEYGQLLRGGVTIAEPE